MRLSPVIAAVLIAATALASPATAKPKLPDWVQHAVDQPAPPRREDEKPTFEVIWDEAYHKVLDNGRIQSNVRYAIRILDSQERWRAKASARYLASSGTRPKIEAWTLHPDGEIYKYKKSDEREKTNSSYLSLKTEFRTVTIDGWNETRTGDVFAYEYTETEATIFTQYSWYFQSSAPVALSRLTINAPDGWNIEETYFHGTPEKTRSGNSVTWEARNILSKKSEPYSPSSAAKQQHMFAIITPPANSPRRFTNLRFDTWADLAAFKAKVADPMAVATPEIAAKARELTKDAHTQWEKIQAIGEFAKAVNYESISLEIGDGGGYTPRPASETFRSNWGDCKDKSTLLRAMLKTLDIDSYVVSLNAIDNDYADERLPNPNYFNHCITAIQVDETIDTPAVYQDENLGRLLFVDPTWNDSPIGEIPYPAQGGLAVVGKLVAQPLVRLPLSTPEENKIKREIIAELLPDGTILGRTKNTLHGQPAVEERASIARKNRKEYTEKLNNRFAASGNPSPILTIIDETDDLLGDRAFHNTIDFGFKDYAKQMQNVLMIFKPAILERIVDNPFSENKRTLPVRLRAQMIEETAKIFLPLDYTLEEFEHEISIETDFGSYHSTITENQGELHYTRTYKRLDTTVPVERYQELQAFYNAVIEAEQKPVVLAKKNQ